MIKIRILLSKILAIACFIIVTYRNTASPGAYSENLDFVAPLEEHSYIHVY